jgi:outer membrane protein OmpA-like peptidoglycan-associated protein
VSSDGTRLVVFVNGSLNMASKGITRWENPIELKEINTGFWQADANFSSDNNALFFTSARATNFNIALNNLTIREQRNLTYHGESGESVDMYVSLKNEDGNWGEAINLGPMINTNYNERSPFLHPDMKTLYFSSSGHGGLGSMDVFKSTRLSDTCWTCWSKPVNLGKEINTIANDWGFKINTDGNLAVYAKNIQNSEFDLFSIKLPLSMRPDFVATIKGKLTDSQNTIVEAQIKWEDLELNKPIGVSNVDPETGEYFIILPMGKLYGYYVDKKGYFPIANNLDLRKYNKPISISNDIKMVSIEEMKKQGVSVIANNLFFETNKSDLLPYSIPELERVAKIIKSTTQMIQIAGHTDDVGNVPANQLLSIKRAESVMKYLVSLGCDPARISSTGFGKSMPIADNKTEAGRAVNRRVEVKFITL